MTTPRSHSSRPPASARRARSQARPAQTATDGYDADGGDPETGLETMSLARDEEGELGSESGLSLDAEDLGPRMLESALQGSHVSHGDDTAGGDSPSEPGGLDLTQNVIDEGSLFDQPRDEGGTRRPEIRTDEVNATLDRNLRASRERSKLRSRR